MIKLVITNQCSLAKVSISLPTLATITIADKTVTFKSLDGITNQVWPIGVDDIVTIEYV